MRNGGTTQEDGADDRPGAEGGTGRSTADGPSRSRRRRLLTSAVAVALLAVGAAVPLVLADSGDRPPCREIPASTRALADDPAAATRALDPGDDMSRYEAVRTLLRHEHPCGDGAEVLGRVVEAATVAAAPGTPHRTAQARGAFAVTAALDGVDLPDAMAPSVARMLADYVVDEARYLTSDSDSAGPAVAPGTIEPDQHGWTEYGRFLAPGEAHTDFQYRDPLSGAEADPGDLIGELAKSPEAFAILYDAERAYFAHYLERLTDEGADPDFRAVRRADDVYTSTGTTWPDNDLEDIAERVGALMKHRAQHTRDGAIADLGAFDTAVRRHTRGAHRPAARQVTTRPPMGDIAERAVSGPVRGDLTDGRHQLLTVLDDWAQARGVPERRTSAMRQLIDDAYVRGLWMVV
ncbi:hypothetical protein ADL00_08960 [Streptomyces sp. AS58]|uniref:hypothetical protein n=1 Tax=Streptomyces sp. AS58 TaxID=1519489 RepID=UPI0006AE3E82|nr:hypothetical protein [Streptomyces sp. AS58]KOV70357.1 hypothetical protein ADL00_08960 [Streptomyces sp. AS58]